MAAGLDAQERLCGAGQPRARSSSLQARPERLSATRARRSRRQHQPASSYPLAQPLRTRRRFGRSVGAGRRCCRPACARPGCRTRRSGHFRTAGRAALDGGGGRRHRGDGCGATRRSSPGGSRTRRPHRLGRLEEARDEFERLAQTASRIFLWTLNGRSPTRCSPRSPSRSTTGTGGAAPRAARALRRDDASSPAPPRSCWGPVARYLGPRLGRGRQTCAARSPSSRSRSRCRGGWGIGRSSPRRELNLAQVLLRRGAAGDRERATQLLDSCLDCPQELGMAGLSERALALKLELRDSPASTSRPRSTT